MKSGNSERLVGNATDYNDSNGCEADRGESNRLINWTVWRLKILAPTAATDVMTESDVDCCVTSTVHIPLSQVLVSIIFGGNIFLYMISVDQSLRSVGESGSRSLIRVSRRVS